MIYDDPTKKPDALVPILRNVPKELKEIPNWVYWRWTWAKSRKSWTKPPYRSKKVLTSIKTFSHLKEFDKVRDFAAHGFDGVGFVFTESDNFVGVDIDDCIREGDGAIDILASCILTAGDTYTEYSPSGTGVKLFFLLPETPTLHSHIFSCKGLKIEVYHELRYFTVTGHVCNGFDKPLQTSMDNFLKVMDLIHDKVDKTENPISEAHVPDVADEPLPVEASDADATKTEDEGATTQSVSLSKADIESQLETAKAVVESIHESELPYMEDGDFLITPENYHLPNHQTVKQILESKHRDRFIKLWIGDLSDFANDQNRGDLSLCWLLAKHGNPIPSDIDSLFRQSALYRGKWDRWDYRNSTLVKAIDKVVSDEKEGAEILRPTPQSQSLGGAGNGGNNGNAKGGSGLDGLAYEIPAPDTLPFGDTWNASTFYLNRSNQYYWLEDWQRFYLWNQTRWQLDGTLRIKNDFNTMVREMATAMLQSKTDDDSPMLKHLVSSLSSKSTNAALELYKPMVAAESTIFDGNPDLLNAPNGIVDLRTGEMMPHDRSLHINQQVSVPYSFDDCGGAWLDFLSQVQPDPEMRAFLRRAVGYTLTGHDTEQCLFYLYGIGKNGKTTFIEPIRHLLEDYAIRAPSQMLQSDQFKTGNDYSVPELRGRRMVVHSEVVAHKRLDEGLVKDLTGSEGLVGRRPYAREYDRFQSVSKHWLYGNHLVRIQGTDEGIWRRIMLVAFEVRIDKPDKSLLEKLKSEDEQIKLLTWAVWGAREWYEEGLNPPEGVIKATESYREGQDDVREFLSQYTDTERGGFVASAALWDAYNESFDGALNRRQFAQRITSLHGESSVERTTEGIRRGWGGLTLNQ